MLVETVCIAVATLTGLFCSSDPHVYQTGDCEVYNTIAVCEVDLISDEIYLRAQIYTPHTCVDYEWNINCYYDEEGKSTGEFLGDGTPTAEAYNFAIACPEEMYGIVIEFEYAGVRQCRDSGSGLYPRFSRLWTGTEFKHVWYLPIDFLLWEEENWQYMLLDYTIVSEGKDNTISKQKH